MFRAAAAMAARQILPPGTEGQGWKTPQAERRGEGIPDWQLCQALFAAAENDALSKSPPHEAPLSDKTEDLAAVRIGDGRDAAWVFGSAAGLCQHIRKVTEAVRPALGLEDGTAFDDRLEPILDPICQLLGRSEFARCPALVAGIPFHPSVSRECRAQGLVRRRASLRDHLAPLEPSAKARWPLHFGNGRYGPMISFDITPETGILFEPPPAAGLDAALAWISRKQDIERSSGTQFTEVYSESVGLVPDLYEDTLERGSWHACGRTDWTVLDEDGTHLAYRHPDLQVWLLEKCRDATSAWAYYLEFALHENGKVLDFGGVSFDFNRRQGHDRLVRRMFCKAVGLVG
jgi:hypothetical protein